jgi:large subunit ribosomal protein L17
MRHRNARTKLSRTSSHRKALLGNLATELLRHERIQTTHTKAMALRSTVAKVITLAKRQDLAARRRVLRLIRDEEVVSKLFETLAKRYKTRQGGYTRIFRLAPRRGDGAPLAIIELMDREQPGVETPPPAPEKKPGLRERFFGG